MSLNQIKINIFIFFESWIQIDKRQFEICQQVQDTVIIIHATNTILDQC